MIGCCVIFGFCDCDIVNGDDLIFVVKFSFICRFVFDYVDDF